jgi:hypothetical protein
MKKEAIRVSSMVPTAPTTLYLDWLQSDQHGAMIGSTAKVDPQVGGEFSTLNGSVSGKLLALDLGRRIVMSWRSTTFPKDAADSRVELTLEAIGGSSRVTVLQTEIPEGLGTACKQLWEERYFAPMRAFFSKYLPDPRKPPPPRPPPQVEFDEEEDEDSAPPARAAKLVKGGSTKTKSLAAKPFPASAKSERSAKSEMKASEPTKKDRTKPSAPKKAEAKKPAPKKAPSKNAAPKKPAPKKAPSKNAAPKKPAPKKPAPKKTPKSATKKKR